MSGSLLVRRGVLWFLMAGMLSATPSSYGVRILSGPTFTMATNAPLAGLLKLTTDANSRVSVSVKDGTNTWQRDFYDYGTTHSIPLLGFKPGRTNTITATAYDPYRNTATAAPFNFITSALPTNFPKLVTLVSIPAKMEPGYTLFRVINSAYGTDYLTIVNSSGEVVWYCGNSSNAITVDVRQLTNGDLFYPENTTNFVEINMLGDPVNTWTTPAGLPIDFHDGVPTDHGTILYLNTTNRLVPNFPTSATNPAAPVLTAYGECDHIIELSATNGALLNNWSIMDMLQPTRIDYLTFSLRTANGWDAEHGNAILDNTADGSILVSVRNQDAVIKFSRATGALKWILGPPENWASAFQPYLLTPVGTPFQWHYAQHGPMLTPQGTLLVYDNGNYRASPFATSVPDGSNDSRAVEYQINEQTMQVSQVWEYRNATNEHLFTPTVGNADWLPKTSNVLVTFGAITYVNGNHPSPYATYANMARIKEVTHDAVPQVVFDLAVFDYSNTNSTYRGDWVYRSHRISDLYAHPALPVADLAVTWENGMPHLAFSADPARTYAVEASTDMVHWEQIGEAVLEDNGDFKFVDGNAKQPQALFYRVIITQ